MRAAEIEVGKTYYVRIPKDVDEYLHMMDSGQRPRGWARQPIHAEVLEVGVPREVIDRMTLNLAGSPRVRTGEHTVNGGIKIRFQDRGRDRVEIVPARSLQWEVDPS